MPADKIQYCTADRSILLGDLCVSGGGGSSINHTLKGFPQFAFAVVAVVVAVVAVRCRFETKPKSLNRLLFVGEV